MLKTKKGDSKVKESVNNDIIYMVKNNEAIIEDMNGKS